ncbi:MAG: cupin domain-containing protein [Pseudomonadota bacterium]
MKATNAGPRAIRRIVTGLDSSGQSTLITDGASPYTLETAHAPGLVVTDLWKTYGDGGDIRSATETCTSTIKLAPAAGGSVFRVVEFPPDRTYMDTWDAYASFEAMGEAKALDGRAGKKPGMHITETLDYAIVLSGEIWAVMDVDETLLKAGDVLVQRGTNHGWSNRGEAPALVAFVLIDAQVKASASPASR